MDKEFIDGKPEEWVGAVRMYTVTTGAKVLGMKPNSLRVLALKHSVGIQPGGKGTPRLFTKEMLLFLRKHVKRHKALIEQKEDREELGLGPIVYQHVEDDEAS